LLYFILKPQASGLTEEEGSTTVLTFWFEIEVASLSALSPSARITLAIRNTISISNSINILQIARSMHFFRMNSLSRNDREGGRLVDDVEFFHGEHRYSMREWFRVRRSTSNDGDRLIRQQPVSPRSKGGHSCLADTLVSMIVIVFSNRCRDSVFDAGGEEDGAVQTMR